MWTISDQGLPSENGNQDGSTSDGGKTEAMLGGPGGLYLALAGLVSDEARSEMLKRYLKPSNQPFEKQKSLELLFFKSILAAPLRDRALYNSPLRVGRTTDG